MNATARAEGKLGFVGPLPYGYISGEVILTIGGVEVAVANVIDWARGVIEYVWHGRTMQIVLSKEQIDTLKKAEPVSGKTEDGTSFALKTKATNLKTKGTK